jgi:hypothetical protein
LPLAQAQVPGVAARCSEGCSRPRCSRPRCPAGDSLPSGPGPFPGAPLLLGSAPSRPSALERGSRSAAQGLEPSRRQAPPDHGLRAPCIPIAARIPPSLPSTPNDAPSPASLDVGKLLPSCSKLQTVSHGLPEGEGVKARARAGRRGRQRVPLHFPLSVEKWTGGFSPGSRAPRLGCGNGPALWPR